MRQHCLDAESLMLDEIQWQNNLTSHTIQYTAFYQVSPVEKQQWVCGYRIAS